MPTYEISGNDQTLTLSQAVSAEPALRIGGNRNSVTLGANFTAAGAGPAVLMTGADNYMLLHWGSSLWTSGTVAIQGSDFADIVYNNRGAVHGDVLLGGGNDTFQNNFDCLVGRVYGGEGNDALRTFQGSVSVHYFGEAGNDGLGGGSAADELDGGAGDDSLNGYEGNDQLTGGGGIDRLTGGLGNDQLAGGGDEGDLAIFAGNWADFTISIAAGAGTVTDTKASDGDQGSDTLTGISELRFTDQQVDTRLTRDELVLTTAGETFTNSVDRYGYTAVDLRGENAVFVNHAEIRGTAVSHGSATGAVGLNAYHVTVENRAGASIIGFDDAIGTITTPSLLQGVGLRLVNDGLVRSLENDAIDARGEIEVVNNATGVIDAADTSFQSVAAIAVRNGNATVVNAGLIHGGDYSIDTNRLILTNSGTISGRLDIGAFSSIDNSGSISGGYTASGALTLVNSGQSSGDLALDVGPVGQLYMSYPAGYTYANLDNRSDFAGNIRITGEARFNSLPASHRDYLAIIANSGTITGSVTSDPTLKPINGTVPDASFVEQVTNSGTITGDVRLGDGNDSLTNSGTIGGIVDGGAGNDVLTGGGGVDRLYGGAGNDIVDGGDGNDQLFGGDGDDSLSGGAGADAIAIAGGGTTVAVDGGADGDTITLGAFAGAAALTLGSGQDVLAFSGYVPGGTLAVGDFLAGNAGDRLDWKPFLQSWLTGWDGVSDPFAARYLSLVQSGADVLVRIDRDGAAGPGGFVTFLTLQNVSAPALTAFNLDGITPRADIVGTEGNDVIQGTSGNDLIEGLGGTDQLFGNDGDDRLEGGEGTDYLVGGAGNDIQYGGAGNDFMIDNSATPGDEQLYGEAGNDFMSIEWFTGTVARSALVEGGIGNDVLDFYIPGRFVDQATLIGGEGDDRIAAEGGLNVTIDAGSGADRVGLRQGPTNYMVTLGTGADILSISSNSNYPAPANIVVTDFETGDAGDRLELLAYCDLVLTNWDQATNPFATGHLRLTQSGADTLVQIDRDGAGSAQGFVNLATFQNLTAGALTAFNLGGFPSDGSKPAGLTITGTASANTLNGTLGDDIIQGLGGNDQIRGRAGDDQIDGGDQDDGIAGDQGDDVIHGGGGADGMSGGLGDDMLYGDAGNDSLGDRDGGDDQLFGGAGYDWISVDRGGAGPGDNILIDAGDDGALIQFFAQNRFIDTVTIQGSDSIEASDQISVNGGGIVTVDAGAGDDRITVGNLGGAVSVTFGAGTDSLYLLGLPIGGLITVEDLAGGTDGDRIYVQSVFNPYQMIQRGDDAILQVDMNGSAAGGYVDYVIVKNVLASDLVLSSDYYYWAPGDQIDDPAVAVDDTIPALEGELITGGALLINDSDLDGPPLSIAMVNGSAANVGQFITLASGAQLRVSAGGGWDYRAIGATFAPTPDFFGSGASNLYTYDSFTYTLAGGGTATVTVQVRGVDSADTLMGTAGDDTLSGGYFDDLYHVENAGDVVVEQNGRGNDRVVAGVSYALGGNAEVETLEAAAGTAPINLTGNSFSQTIIGNAGANILHGGGGADVLIGLGGNDVYYADVAAVQVQEAAGGGTDRLFTSVSYALAGGSEIEVLSTNNHAATDAINLTGNSFDNVLIGNAGSNVLHGGGGTDLLIGLAGQDIYYVDVASTSLIEYEGGGNDALYVSTSYVLVNGEVELLSANNYLSTGALNLTGNLYAQTLIGNAGVNILNGGGGADLLVGLGGNDIYYVDLASVTIQESPGGGNDTVYTSVSYALTPGMDIETLSTNDYSAVISINLTGNGLANQLLGNAGNNAFIGGGGADVMFGMGGDDIYYIDVASVQIVENPGGGSDIVYAGIGYALASGVDVEILSTNNYASTDAIDLVGNAVNQTLLGNDGANFLDGGSGNDVLRGFGGADTFAFTQAIDADTIVDFVSGTDRIALDDNLFAGIGGPGALAANVFVVGNAAADADDRIIYNQASGQLFYDADGNGAGAAVLFANLAGAPVIAASDFLVI